MEQQMQYNYFLPKEMLIFIFSFLDRRTLVFSCRPVCKFWKEVSECSEVWKTQISREAKAYCSELQNILPKAHLIYPWYMCYVLCKNIFYKKLLPGCCYVGLLTHWRGETSHSTGRVSSAPLEIDLAHGYDPAPPDVLDDGAATCLLMCFGKSGLNQSIDLYRSGFTRKIFEFCPPIHFSEWFAVGYNFTGTCHLEVSFYDSQWRRDNENGVFRYSKRLANREWHHVTHTFTNYRSDVRYITLSHGVNTYLGSRCGRFTEIVTFGKAAAKVAGTKFVITLPELME